MVVALEDCFDQPWEVATLFSRFVDRDAERCEPGEIHQKVVDKIANAAVVVISQDVAEGDAVRTAERVVADEGESAAVAVVGKIFESVHLNLHVQIFHGGIQPRHAFYVARCSQMLVDFILVGDALQPVSDKTGHVASLFSRLGV